MPTLDDYEYQFGDIASSVKLNKINAVYPQPIWDVVRVTGLDMPPFRQIVHEIDGQHGADVFARYLGPRTIIVDGVLYALADEIDEQIDQMKDSLFDTINFESQNFYFKHPGIAQRYCAGKAVGFTADVDTGRRTGRCVYQLRILCEDPLTYIQNPLIEIGNGPAEPLINDGNVDTGIKVVFRNGTLSGTTTIRDDTNDVELTFSATATASDRIEVDTRKRRIQKNNNDITGSVIDANWWLNKSKGGAQDIIVTWTGDASVDVLHWSGWW